MTVSLTTFRDRLPTTRATHAPLPTASSHKVYRTWHFDVVCSTAEDPAGSTRFTVPIASGPWADNGTGWPGIVGG